MASIPHPYRLTPDEREVVITYNDAEKLWHVYSDSLTLRGAILRLARQLGAEVRRAGAGVEFGVPGDALRVVPKRKVGGRGRPFRSTRDTRRFEGNLGLLEPAVR